MDFNYLPCLHSMLIYKCMGRFILSFSMVLILLLSCGGEEMKTLFKKEIDSGIMIEAVAGENTPLDGIVEVCKCGEHHQIITEGYTGASIPLYPGTYDLRIKARGDEIWITEVEVKEGEFTYRKVRFPNARMLVQLIDGENHLDASVLIYRVDSPDLSVADTWTETVIDLPPGEYFAVVEFVGMRGVIDNINLSEDDRKTYSITVDDLEQGE